VELKLGERLRSVSRRKLVLVIVVMATAVIAVVSVALLLNHRDSPRDRQSRTEAAVSGTEPAVPGGAAVAVSPGSPPVCSALAGSGELRHLASVIREAAVVETAASGSAKLWQSAANLRDMASDAGPPLNTAITVVADAMGRVASAPADRTAMQALATALNQLGSEAQRLCGFPVTSR
jgi:hypothetical protein